MRFTIDFDVVLLYDIFNEGVIIIDNKLFRRARIFNLAFDSRYMILFRHLHFAGRRLMATCHVHQEATYCDLNIFC